MSSQTGQRPGIDRFQISLERSGNPYGPVIMTFADEMQRQHMIELLTARGFTFGSERTRSPHVPVILVPLPEDTPDCGESHRPATAASAAGVGTLTPREREVLELVAKGHTNKQAAAELSISARTVENHRAQIMRKLNASGLAQLVRITIDAATE